MRGAVFGISISAWSFSSSVCTNEYLKSEAFCFELLRPPPFLRHRMHNSFPSLQQHVSRTMNKLWCFFTDLSLRVLQQEAVSFCICKCRAVAPLSSSERKYMTPMIRGGRNQDVGFTFAMREDRVGMRPSFIWERTGVGLSLY